MIVKQHISKEVKVKEADHESTLKWLMKTYGNDVMRVAYIYLKNKQMAEDVTQDVFLRCFEKIDGFRYESSYKTWIIKITTNRCKDILKSWQYRNIFISEVFNIKQFKQQLFKEPTSNEEDEMISKQVMNLPIKLREVIILYYYQEFSISEISNLLNTNENTVKTRLFRAREKLKKALQEGWEFYGK
ncbi:sigma-70 family RNA polymerase sigma factor [Bacillus sp. FJAT-27445]|uniref:sigma-70 family RNA polymerase sigma factor n=1 Tax=Bacillus sp. FJAT-27445 TaxID=1679166 RepID=UPI0007442343|nr:sigma-70 family RNA polymerase sigma factor [Bacillus sp. FJAT-27445]